jgi:C4-dicarboxylate transporter, DctM subunit
MQALPGVLEALAIFVLVIGGLYAGLFTPTEAGAVGVFCTFIVSLTTGKLTWNGVVNSIRDTLWISCMCFFLITGATIFGKFLAVTRLPFIVADFAAGLPVSKYVILSFVMVIYIIGGCVMDALGFLVVTIPIFFPLGLALGFDPDLVLHCPDHGHHPWSHHTAGGRQHLCGQSPGPQIALGDIFKSVSFFVAASAMCIVILTIFPEIALVLPGLLRP